MIRIYKIIIVIITAILMLISVALSQEPKQRNDSVTAKTNNENNYCMPMLDFFRDTLLRAGKSGGMAWTKQSCAENLAFPELSATNFTLKDNLDLITQKNKNYRWENNNDVLNLLPSKSVPKLLNVRIKDLKVTFKNNLSIVADSILHSPEVIKEKENLHLREGIYHGGLSSPPDKRPATEMTFHNKTVKEILNEVLRKHGRGVWLYRESYYNGTNTFTLDFVVQ